MFNDTREGLISPGCLYPCYVQVFSSGTQKLGGGMYRYVIVICNHLVSYCRFAWSFF